MCVVWLSVAVAFWGLSSRYILQLCLQLQLCLINTIRWTFLSSSFFCCFKPGFYKLNIQQGEFLTILFWVSPIWDK